jgi:hypothetical protein
MALLSELTQKWIAESGRGSRVGDPQRWQRSRAKTVEDEAPDSFTGNDPELKSLLLLESEFLQLILMHLVF